MSIRIPSSFPRRPARAFAIAFALGAALVAMAAPAHAGNDDDPMADYRERFKTGLEKYKAGAVAEAIKYWEPIYRELGAAKGYRLAFNLARAYETFGDFTRAGERYESFLAEVSARRANKEKLDAIVEREEREARGRLSELQASKGRIKVNAGDRPVAVRIDAGEPRVSGFVAYVPPGDHVVVLGPGTATPERRDVSVKAGEVYEITPVHHDVAPPAAAAYPQRPHAGQPRSFVTRTVHPFSPAVLYIAGGVTLASAFIPLVTYQNAHDYQSTHVLSGNQDALSQQSNDAIRSEYRSQATTYYVTLAIPITLAAATTGLVAWYFLASKTERVPVVTPAAGATRGGGVFGLRGSF